MSMTAATQLVRRLERISTDMLRRSPNEKLGDLLQSAASLEDDVRAVGVPDLTAVWHLRMGEILYREGRYTEAVSQSRAALCALGSRREADLHVAALELQARSLDDLADWDALDAVVEEGIAIVERHRYSLSAPYLKSAYMRARIALYALGVRAAIERGDLPAVIRRAELSKCRSFSRASQGNGRSGEAREVEQRLRAVTKRINHQQHSGCASVQLVAERRMLWDRFISVGRDASPPPVPDIGAVRAVLNEREAVLYYYWVDRNQLLRLTLDSRRHALESVRVDSQRRQALDDLASALSSRADRVDKHVVDEIDTFHDVLWPADRTARAILEEADRLIVSPHRQLHSLPFGALKVDGAYVIQRWSVRHAPNLAALLPYQGSETPGRGLLTVGVTRYQVPNTPLRALPAAADECRDVAALYQANDWSVTQLLDEAADEAAISAAMRSRPAVAHFACHGQSVEADTPLESCLYLQRSMLDGLEIPLMGVAPRMVVLSACGAGQRAIAGRGMPELPGDDLLGLQAAFFAGGTREIVAPLYPVDDKVARWICSAFHRYHLAGDPADIALANAMRGFLDGANLVTRRRYFWAPFFFTALGPNAPRSARPKPPPPDPHPQPTHKEAR